MIEASHGDIVMDALELMHLAGTLLNNHDTTQMDRQRLGWLLTRSAVRLGSVVEAIDHGERLLQASVDNGDTGENRE